MLRHGLAGETYNIPGSLELTNREVVAALLERLGKPWSLVRTVADRLGHDRRYAMDGSKLAALGWRNRTSFEDGIASTVDWFVANEAWWRAIRSGDWDAYYERQYGARLAGSTPGRLTMRVAVTGAGGRLGRALVAALDDAPFTGMRGPLAWPRAIFDLDAPDAVGGLLDRERPEVVVHAAAWTDVDGCARDPELALRRNGVATGVLARACAERGIDLIVVSTNEVFDGRRTDGRGYAVTDEPAPINAYGASKLAGERAACEAFASRAARGAWRSSARPGSSARARPTSRPRSWPPPIGRPRPASRSGSSATSGAVRRTSPTWPRRSSRCSARTTPAGIHHVVNGALRDARRLGPLRRRPGGPGGRRRRRPERDLDAGLDAAALGRARADAAARAACPSGRGRTRWPTTRRSCCAAGAPVRPASRPGVR